MASIMPFLFLIPLIFFQNVFSQLVPIGNGCFCQQPQVPQKQLINLQLTNPGCNCQKNLPYQNIPLNVPINQPVNGLQIYNGVPFHRPALTNLPNGIPLGNVPVINGPIYNNIPMANLPVLNVPSGQVFNNVPVANLPVFNAPVTNMPIKNLPINAVQFNANPVQCNANRSPINNLQIANLPVRNIVPMPNNFISNLPVNNLPVNYLNNGVPINVQNGQVPNGNVIQLNVPSNLPINNQNPRQNFNILPVNNLPFNPPNQIVNLPVSQQQFTNVPNGINLNQILGYSPQSVPNVPNNDCGCQSGLASFVENSLPDSSSNQANNSPLLSMNGLQLGGLGGLGNLPLFNGLPVIGVQESVVNLKPQCSCQN